MMQSIRGAGWQTLRSLLAPSPTLVPVRRLLATTATTTASPPPSTTESSQKPALANQTPENLEDLHALADWKHIVPPPRPDPLLQGAAEIPLSNSAATAVPPTVPPLPVLEEAPPPPEPTPRVRRPVGAFRGGLIGFLAGVTLVGGYGYFGLLEDYAAASGRLLASVEELKASTSKLSHHIQRIEAVEHTIGVLQKEMSKKSDLTSQRDEYRSLIESQRLEVLALKAHLWGVEQDLHSLAKIKADQNNVVRI